MSFDNAMCKDFIKSINSTTIPDGVAIRYDDNKAPLHLLDTGALYDTAMVFGYGAIKYPPNNWRKGMDITRILNSVGRHVLALQNGEDYDEESGLKHAAHAISGLMMFIGTMRDMPEFDNRYNSLHN